MRKQVLPGPLPYEESGRGEEANQEAENPLKLVKLVFRVEKAS